jgi:hypothetical protein
MQRQSKRPTDWYQIALFYHLQILLQHGSARHREMGQKRMRNHGCGSTRRTATVYTIRVYRLRCMGFLALKLWFSLLVFWDGNRRSAGPTYRYPSTRRLWSLTKPWSSRYLYLGTRCLQLYFEAIVHAPYFRALVILSARRHCESTASLR